MARIKHQLHFETTGSLPEYDRTILHGLVGIAKYMGVAPATIGKWIRAYGFPAGQGGKGKWLSSTALIDLWILSRNRFDPANGLDPKAYRRVKDKKC